MKQKGIRGMIEKLNEPNNFLSGIYNYCDGWCERCAFTDRCLNYASRSEYGLDDESTGGSIDKTFEGISEMFADLISFLKEEAEKKGIDLDEEIDMSEEENARQKAESHPLAEKTWDYLKIVDNWLKSRKGLLTKKAGEFLKFAELGLNEEKIENDVKTFQDALEVVQWYFTLIRVKIIRALHTKFDNTFGDDEFKYEQVNTSAKIALIGCEKSLNAWRIIYKHLSEDEDKILKILAYLSELKKDIIKEFPDVVEFKRPYFD